MPRRREHSEEREEKHQRHKKHKSRSHSSEEDRKPRKHKRKSRSRSISEDREHHSHRDRHHHNRDGHRNRDEHQYDPNKRIKKERVDGRIKQERVDDMQQQRNDRRQNNDRRRRTHRQREEEGVDMNFGRPDQNVNTEEPVDKAKPDFKLSGKLTEDTNTFRGVVVNYNEPPEARKPKKKWRLYPFKGDSELPVLHIHRQSAYLIGRDRRVADIPVDHPSCSKQHAAFQYRLTEFRRDDGSKGMKVKPYVIDLNSANGTYVNNEKIEGQRYMELFEKDVIKFGYSSREYVILHDKVDTSELLDEEGID